MSVGNDVVPESGSALSRSACGSKNGQLQGGSKSAGSWFYASPPLKKGKRSSGTTAATPTSVSSSFSSTSAASERRGWAGGQTAPKKRGPAAKAMPVEQERMSEIDVEARCFPSDCVGRMGAEGAWKIKTSEKVTQWLEDSCQSTVTGIAMLVSSTATCAKLEPRVVTLDSEAGQEEVGSHTHNEQGGHNSCQRGGDASAKKIKFADQRLSGTTLAPQADLTATTSGKAVACVCGIRYSVRCLKMIACLPIVLLGLYLKVRPNSWGQFDPPPT
ncbi:hypothetical protein MPTK2_3g09070 [Marchantia polymorpha subsp. ruderalis]